MKILGYDCGCDKRRRQAKEFGLKVLRKIVRSSETIDKIVQDKRKNEEPTIHNKDSAPKD